MNKYLFLFSILLLAVGCSKDKAPDNKGQLDPDAMISLRPAEGARSETNHLAALEIVKQAYEISFIHNGFPGSSHLRRGFADHQRDLNPENPRLLMYGTDIIDQYGEYTSEFIEGHDFVLTRQLSITPHLLDTIAYIPNVVIRAAEIAIKAAYADDNYTECYRLFDTAFTFIPITGAEWRALKAEGQN